MFPRIVLSVLAALALAAVVLAAVPSEAEAGAVELAPAFYESADDAGYSISQSNAVRSPSTGCRGYKVTVDPGPGGSWSGSASDPAVVSEGGVSVCIERLVEPGTSHSGWQLSFDEYGGYVGQLVCGGYSVGEIGYGKVLVQVRGAGGSWEARGGAVLDAGDHSIEIPTEHVQRGTQYRVVALSEWRTHYIVEERSRTAGEHTAGIFSLLVPAVGLVTNLAIGGGSQVTEREVPVYTDVCEVFSFYVASSASGALIVRNLTAQADGEDVLASFASLGDGSVTVTGFEIDRGLYRSLEITVEKNSVPIAVEWDGDRFSVTDDGFYKIHSRSSSGHESVFGVYVMSGPYWESYFGQAPLSYEERCLGQDGVPTFVGKVRLDFEPAPSVGGGFRLPRIIAQVDGSPAAPGTEIGEGRHAVTFLIGSQDNGGDILSLTYRFGVVAEAPGPVVNKANLYLSYPQVPVEAFGFDLPSAGGQAVTFIYETYQEAADALLEYERSRVTTLNGVKFWAPEDYAATPVEAVDVEGILQDYVGGKVQRVVLDPSTVLTVQGDMDDVLSCELRRPVVVRGGDFDSLADAPPVIGGCRKTLQMGPDGAYEDVVDCALFRLVGDAEGLDSCRATASAMGREVALDYETPIADQLRDAGMFGVVTIREFNSFDRSIEYTVYMAVEVGATMEMEVSGRTVMVSESGRIAGDTVKVKGVSSDLPCVVRLYPKHFIQESVLLTPDELPSQSFGPGEYVIQVISASGLSYAVTVAVLESVPANEEIWTPADDCCDPAMEDAAPADGDAGFDLLGLLGGAAEALSGALGTILSFLEGLAEDVAGLLGGAAEAVSSLLGGIAEWAGELLGLLSADIPKGAPI